MTNSPLTDSHILVLKMLEKTKTYWLNLQKGCWSLFWDFKEFANPKFTVDPKGFKKGSVYNSASLWIEPDSINFECQKGICSLPNAPETHAMIREAINYAESIRSLDSPMINREAYVASLQKNKYSGV